MESGTASRRLRLAALPALTLCLGALLIRRVLTPTPAWAGVDSDAERCHLIPNDNNRLVIYDARSRCLLSFVAVNGTALRLQGWRNTVDDPRLWDTAQIVKGTTLETPNGSSTQFPQTPRDNPRQGSLIASMEAVRKSLQFTLDGIAGEDATPTPTRR